MARMIGLDAQKCSHLPFAAKLVVCCHQLHTVVFHDCLYNGPHRLRLKGTAWLFAPNDHVLEHKDCNRIWTRKSS